MMNQLYEDKCDCTQYNKMKDHCSSLIKMDLPEYEEGQYSGTKSTIFLRVARLVGCVAIVVLLGYSLWRIQVLDTKIANLSVETYALKYGSRSYSRVRRAVDVNGLNSFTESMGTKDSSLDESIPVTTQKARSHIQRPNKENYDKLIDELFDKMYVLRRDSDKKHLRKNIRAVFEAWSAVFDAAVPYEMVNEDVRQRRSTIVDPSSEESSEEQKNKKGVRERRSVNQDPSSEESSEEQKKQGEKKPTKQKKVKDENNKQSSEESSEEKNRNKRSVDRTDEEPCESEEGKSNDGMNCKKSTKKEESSEEAKEERKEEESSNESKERSESRESTEKKEDEH